MQGTIGNCASCKSKVLRVEFNLHLGIWLELCLKSPNLVGAHRDSFDICTYSLPSLCLGLYDERCLFEKKGVDAASMYQFAGCLR